MAAPRRVAVVVGSLRKDSFNRKIAKALAAMAPPSLSLEIVEIGAAAALQPGPDDANPPAESVAFKRAASRARRRGAVRDAGIQPLGARAC